MMYEIFKDKVMNYGSLVAFVLEDNNRYTYAQADTVVNNLAHQLHVSGVGQGHRVALVTHFESLHPLFLLACDKLNASLVLLDSLSPIQQLHKDITKLKIPHVFVDSNITFNTKPDESSFHPINPKTLIDATDLKSTVPDIEYNPKIPVYIVASSGSSDEKKWIAIPGLGIAYREKLDTAELGLTLGHKFLCTRSPAYDARVYEYLCGLAAGGELHLVSQNDRRDMEKVVQYCEKNQITSLLYIASQLSFVALESYMPRLKIAGLVNLMVTGDTCTPQLRQFCIDHKINLINLYGSTETTFGLSMICANNHPLLNNHGIETVPIAPPDGKNVKISIQNGVLYVISPYLGWYIDNPIETERHFVTLTLENGDNVTAFNSGDLFEIQNGLLLFKGRDDNSLDSKVAGVKVNAGSVQQCIEAYKAIDSELNQVCVVNKLVSERNKLVAYLVSTPKFDCKKLIHYLIGKGLSPAEMPIPISIKTLPILLESNKIDTQALKTRLDNPSEYMMSGTTDRPIIEGTETHRKLALIWENLLHVKPKSYRDNFIHCGGDSIIALRLAAKIKAEIKPEFTYSDLLSLVEISIETIFQRLNIEPSTSDDDLAIIQALTPITEPSKNIMIMLPTILGNGFLPYLKLALAYKNTHQVNVYGLTDPSLYDSSKMPASLEVMIDRYVNAIIKIKPKGAYKLMGFSYGCFIAYHVALKLQALGLRVEEIHLVDGYPATFFQRIPDEQQEKLLNDFSTFIIPVLGNSFYNENIETMTAPSLGGLSKTEQINCMTNHYLKLCKHDLSRNMLNLIRQHLMFMLKDRTDDKLTIKTTRLYLSTPNQNFLPMVNTIPDLKPADPSYRYYYWNQHFQHVSLCAKVADCDHLGLIRESTESKLFFADVHDSARMIFRSGAMSGLWPDAWISGPFNGKRQLIITELSHWRAIDVRKSLMTEWNASMVSIIHLGCRILYERKTIDLLFDHIYAIFCELNESTLTKEDKARNASILLSRRQLTSINEQTQVAIELYLNNEIQQESHYQLPSHPDEIVSRFKSSRFSEYLTYKHDDSEKLVIRCDMPLTTNLFIIKDMIQIRSNDFSAIAMSYFDSTKVNSPCLKHERFSFSKCTWLLAYPSSKTTANPYNMLLHAVANKNENAVRHILENH